MLSNSQKSLLKRAQRQAGICDAEYRSTLEHLTGCRTSTDARLGDAQLDQVLAYFEAIYWRAVDRGILPPAAGNAVFRRRGFWAGRNPLGNTSRDRFNHRAVASVEGALRELGRGEAYLSAIRRRTGPGRIYQVALRRTLRTAEPL